MDKPPNLNGRFLEAGEKIEDGDLVNFSGNIWRKCPYSGLTIRLSCIFKYFRPSERVVFDINGVYVCPYEDKEAAINIPINKIDRKPRGLKGRFLKEKESVRDTDLVDFEGLHNPNYNQFPKWKKVGSGGYVTNQPHCYFRVVGSYSIDKYGYHVAEGDEPICKSEIIDIEEITEPEPIKVISKNSKLILHNDFN